MGTDIKNLTIKIRVGKDPQFTDFEFSKLSESGSTGSGNLLYHTTKQYPIASLLNKDRKERLSFLTNTKKFQELLNQNPTAIAENADNKEKIKVIDNNIVDTLFVLFPTYFEQKKNITTSYDERISKEPKRSKYNLFQLNRSFFLPKEEGDDEYTYYNDKTVDRLVWLNDVYNVPEFVEWTAAVYKFFLFMKIQGKAQVEKNVENNAKILKTDKIIESLTEWEKDMEIDYARNNRTPTTKTTVSPEGKSIHSISTSYANYINANDDNEKDTAVKEIMEQLNYLEGRIVENDRSTKSDTLTKIIKAFTPLVSSYKIKQMFADNRFLIKNEKIRFSKEEERLYTQLKEFPEYKSLEEAIQKFKSAVVKSSNPDLDKLLTDFQDNSKEKEKEQKEFLYFVLAVYKVSTNKELFAKLELTADEQRTIKTYESNKNLPYVGPLLTPSGKYLIYLGLDVISTKLSQKVHTSRNCVYKNEKLGDFAVALYNKLFGSYLQGIENFIVLNNEYILDLPKPPDKPTQGQPMPPAPPSPQVKGGNRFSRKKKAARRRTRTKRRTRVY